MNFQDMEVFKEVGQKALMSYEGGDTCGMELLHLSENITYTVTSQEDGNIWWVMRISRPGYHTLEELQAEICWLKQLVKDTDLIIAKPVSNTSGGEITMVMINGQPYYCIVYQYLSGIAPDPLSGKQSLSDFEQVGRITAILHCQTIRWEEGRALCRPVWDYEALLGRQALLGDWRLCRELEEDGYGIICRTCQVIEKRLAAYGRCRDSFGLIHSDLRSANLLVENGQMKIIDFDDCGYGWYLYDLAAAISFVEDHPMAMQWIEAWIQGYERVRPMKERDYREIETFVMTRRIQLLAWITSHDDSDPVKLYYKGFANRTVRMAKAYLNTYEILR